MRQRQPRSSVPTHWHRALRALIESAARECPHGHAEALRALTALALQKAPARGVFDPGLHGHDDLYSAIEAVAREHLDFAPATRDWRKAIQSAGMKLEQRDDVERAALRLRTASDTAYFYAGLAFGLAYGYVNGRA